MRWPWRRRKKPPAPSIHVHVRADTQFDEVLAEVERKLAAIQRTGQRRA